MKRKHKSRIKLTPYPKLRKQARTIFAAWIRNRDPKCITCNNPTTQAGHFIHVNAYDFDENINHGQCLHCNHFLSGNLGVYTMKMIDLYGIEQVESWHRQKHEVIKFSREFLENVIKKYALAAVSER